jgi:hypothetical protein
MVCDMHTNVYLWPSPLTCIGKIVNSEGQCRCWWATMRMISGVHTGGGSPAGGSSSGNNRNNQAKEEITQKAGVHTRGGSPAAQTIKPKWEVTSVKSLP